MITKQDITKYCTAALTDNEFIVEVNVSANNDITVYVDDYQGITIDECMRIHNAIESNLDRNVEDFSLEVGSPGLTAPFKVMQQYRKNLNQPVEIVAVDGEKIIGTLSNITPETVTIVRNNDATSRKNDDETVTLNFKDIKSTRVQITI